MIGMMLSKEELDTVGMALMTLGRDFEGLRAFLERNKMPVPEQLTEDLARVASLLKRVAEMETEW